MASEDDKPFRLVTEINFALRCLIHGEYCVSFQPRPMDLGHGQMAIDMGRAICRKCGHSTWLTMSATDTKWENVPAKKVREMMRIALEEELGKALDAQPEPDEEDHPEEVIKPEPARATIPAPTTSGLAPFGKRPGFQ